MSISIDFNNGVIQATPVVAAAGADVASRVMGLTLPEWFYVSAILFGVVQTAIAVYRAIKEEKRKDKGGGP